MKWPWSRPQLDKVTRQAHDALEALEDHVLRGIPLSLDGVESHHKALMASRPHLSAEDLTHLKMRLGVIGQQRALED